MGPEEAKKPGALGEPREQHAIVSREPVIKRAIPYAFERM
jgi:hypothetical protein